ncbi:MAG: ATP-binding protein [Bacteroidales bacterium]|nr:ATP-binding protein [Bacteroidales bacterium]
MEATGIIGRNKERHLLEQISNRRDAQLVAIYGRRRVGKTYLVKRFFNEKFDFYFTGSYHTPTAVQLSMFAQALHEYSGQPFQNFSNWMQAFSALKDYLKSLQKENIVVFLDEIPWLDVAKSNFLPSFSQFWNGWASTCEGMKIIVCGSSTTWMLDKFVGDKGGFYGRSNRSIYLAPFTLNETEQFLKSRHVQWTRFQITKLYMIMGGIPYYLDMVDPAAPFDSNIDALFFGFNAPLKNEYDFLFRTLFKNSQLYRRIVELLSSKNKGLTQIEIKELLKLSDGGELSKALVNLQKCDFIRAYHQYGDKKRGVMYQLTDLFSLFHLRFVDRLNGQDEHYWTNLDDHTKDAWTGYAFEMVCLHHITQIKERLGIRGVLTNACCWQAKPQVDKDGTSWKGAQVDLLLNREDNIINLCEMKFSKLEYVITEAYHQHLEERKATFLHHTRAKKSVVVTFITTHGLKKNMHSDAYLPHQVTLDHLFQ